MRSIYSIVILLAGIVVSGAAEPRFIRRSSSRTGLPTGRNFGIGTTYGMRGVNLSWSMWRPALVSLRLIINERQK